MELQDCKTRDELARFLGSRTLEDLRRTVPFRGIVAKALEAGVDPYTWGDRIGRGAGIIKRWATSDDPDAGLRDEATNALKELLASKTRALAR